MRRRDEGQRMSPEFSDKALRNHITLYIPKIIKKKYI